MYMSIDWGLKFDKRNKKKLFSKESSLIRKKEIQSIIKIILKIDYKF